MLYAYHLSLVMCTALIHVTHITKEFFNQFILIKFNEFLYLNLFNMKIMLLPRLQCSFAMAQATVIGRKWVQIATSNAINYRYLYFGL